MGRSSQTARAALTIASSLACMVRGCGEGAAHDSGRHGVAIRGAWRRPGSQERQAGGYGGGVMAIGGGCCLSSGSGTSQWRVVALHGGRLFQVAAGFCRAYPPMSVCPGEVFDAGGGPSCDMNADAERGVVPKMTGISCILSSSRPDAMPTTSRPPTVRITNGRTWFSMMERMRRTVLAVPGVATTRKRKEWLSGCKIAL